MRTGFLFHLASSPASPPSAMVTWCVGSGRWVCLIACGFIHNYSLHLQPKLKYADGPGCVRSAASRGVRWVRARSGSHQDQSRVLRACLPCSVLLFHYVRCGIGDKARLQSSRETRTKAQSWFIVHRLTADDVEMRDSPERRVFCGERMTAPL